MSQPSWKDQIKKKWGPHSHCNICGKAIPPDKKFCSQACRDKYLSYEQKEKKSKNMNLIIMLAIMGGIMLMFLVFI